jgi:predicted DNA-binding antitoxin AbrB/MazE fold protein
MYSVDAIYDGIGFKPLQPIPIKVNYEVTITFVRPVKAGAKKPDLTVDGVVYRDIGENAARYAGV